ncbi:hypothetical protein SAMN05216389_101289 [Oceanobacillus limi]|uniref:Uncharacterized protein n=1 Tax=Oceanobacillus limi TaxID=930131 RepID=A0A1H9YB13_9BACI|nr:DUF6241 domain-containing protein [Oceanobacillus limi]SES65996.1 hypothetical protein SAMN05216389_101289 [Oceanobacillus limi]
MYRVVLSGLVCILIVLIGFGGWNVYQWLTSEEQKSEKDSDMASAEVEELEKQRMEIQGEISEDDLTRFAEEGLNPFGQSTAMNELTDTFYQEYLHGMSHQKVKADAKWGFYEIHPERINWLLAGLNEVELEHEDVYRGILEKWDKGDFTTADLDHNAIWRLQGGTIGEATGVYSPAEEQAYLKSQAE